MPVQYIVFAGFIIGIVLFRRLNNRGIAQVDAKTAHEMIKDSGIVILDVRTLPEFKDGHIKGAVLIPVGEIVSRIGSLSQHQDRQILVYCLTGNRSMAASPMLRMHGFNRVANLKGGMNAWKANGFTVLKGN